MSDCLICKKHAKPIASLLRENEHAALVHYPASAAEPAVYRGHLMVEVRRHVTSFGELSEEEASEVGKLIAHGSSLLTNKLAAEHVYVFTIGHMVPHLHVHVLPRYAGTPEEFWGGMRLTDWPEGPRLDESGVATMVERLLS